MPPRKSSGKKAAKGKSTKKPSPYNHPGFAKMIVLAIEDSDNRKGASRQAIKKYIEESKYTVPEKYSHYLNQALKKGVESKTLVQTGQTFRLSAAAKRKAAGTKKAAPKKKTTGKKRARTTTTTKKAAPKKKTPKKKKKLQRGRTMVETAKEGRELTRRKSPRRRR